MLRDDIAEIITNNCASFKKEGADDMADIYGNDFINELLTKYTLVENNKFCTCGIYGYSESESKCPECKKQLPPY